MTAGAATVAFTVENSYGDGPSADPTWYQPGVDVSVGELTVEQALERIRQPDDPTPAGSREGNWEGAASVSFSLTDDNWHDLVFADSGTALPHSAMRAPSAAWYFGNDMPDGTTESRVATGAIVPEATVNYEQGSDVSVELTILYGFEPTDVSAPANITQPSDTDVYEWHSASFQVDGMGQSLMQSATLSLAGLARFRRGQDRHPYDAVVDAIESSFSTDATFTGRDQLALAVDDVDDTVGKVPATLSFENGQGNTIGYNLTGCQPNTYNWSELVTPDTDLSEPIDYHIADCEVA